MEWGTFSTPDWSSPPVLIARSFRQRKKGLRPTADGVGMLLRGRSVHGFGMAEPLLSIGLDRERRVVGFRVLLPHRIVLIRRAKEILELPIGPLPPLEGVVLTWERGGSAGPVRNTHRKSK